MKRATCNSRLLGFVICALCGLIMGWLIRSAFGTAMNFEPLESRRLLSAFYVAPAGSDSAIGDSAHPWLTLQHASDSAGPGDTVSARAGKYAGFVRGWDSPQNGTAGSAVAFHGEAGAIIDRRNGKTADGIDIEGSDYITVEGFTLQPASGQAAWRSGIRMAGGPVGGIIRNNRTAMRTIDSYGIYSSFAVDLSVTGNDASGTNNAAIYTANSALRPVISFNSIHDVGTSYAALHFNGDASQGGSGLIDGATVEGNYFLHVGIAINMDGAVRGKIINNFVEAADNKGINLYDQDAAAGSYDNLVSGNVIAMEANAFFALGARNGSSGCTFTGNYCLCLNHCILTDASSRSGLFSDNNVIGEGDINTGQDAHTTRALAGDVNLDGQVTPDDYVCAAVYMGQTRTSWIMGDVSGNGRTGREDYDLIAAEMNT